MAGITTPAFRRSVRRWGAGLVFTEMISAYGMHYDNRRTLDYLACGDDEHPIGFQLFGADAGVAGRRRRPLRARRRRPRRPQHGLPGAQGDEDRGRRGAAGRAGARRRHRARRRRRAAGPGVPVTVKIRAGLRDGDEAGRRAGAPPRRRRRGRRLHPPAHGGPALPRPRRPRGHAGAGAGAAGAGDRLGRRRRPRRARSRCSTAARPPSCWPAPPSAGPGSSREVLDGAPRAGRRRAARGGAPLRRRRARRSMGPRGVGYLRQFWPRFRRSGALDRPLAQALMQARRRRRGARSARPLSRACDEAPTTAFAQGGRR